MNPRDRLARADRRMAEAMKSSGLRSEPQDVTLLAGIFDLLYVIAEAQLATPPSPRGIVADGLDDAI